MANNFATDRRTTREVALAHIRAVVDGAPAAMAADYADDAVLMRGADRYEGHAAIAAYFATVADRLGSNRVIFDDLRVDGDTAIFDWHLDGSGDDAGEGSDGGSVVSGTDTCTISDGMIVRQEVQLHRVDF